MKRYILLSFFIILNASGFSQEDVELYQFPLLYPPAYTIDASADYERMSQQTVKGVKKRDINRFSEMSSYGKKDLFTSGTIYFNWKEYEAYLNAILKRLIPNDLGKKEPEIYIDGTPSYNAYTIDDGSIFINIGLLAEVYNEASLAAVIAHELAHYINDDPKNQFIDGLRIERSKRHKNKSKLRLDHAHNNRASESSADSLGFVLMNKAGYNPEYARNNFIQFLMLEEPDSESDRKKTEDKNNTSENDIRDLEELLASHPLALERIKLLDKYLEVNKAKMPDAGFLENESIFIKLQQQAKLESLAYYLDYASYEDCVEKSFYYYLFEPTNNQYLTYLIEGIRRHLFIEEHEKTNGFLNHRFKNHLEDGKSILTDLRLLVRDSLQFNKINIDALYQNDSAVFNTTEEAFTYFSALAEKRGLVEPLLSIALYALSSEPNRAVYLQKYSSMPNAKHKEYAQYLLDGKLSKKIEENDKQQVILDNISFYENHYYGVHKSNLKSEELSPELLSSLAYTFDKQFPEKDLVYVDDLRKKNFRSFITLKKMIVTTLLLQNNMTRLVYQEDEDTYEAEGLFVLSPEYWYYLKNNNLKSIEYLNMAGYDDRKSILKIITVTLFSPFIIAGKLILANYLGIRPEFQSGSRRYAHSLEYYKYDAAVQKTIFDSRDTYYKLNTAHFSNSVYYLVKRNNNVSK